MLNAQGNVVSEARHYPYGEERWHTSTLPTDYRFTGQAYEQSLGLYHMGARWYDPSLGRWLSADTIVPEPANPQLLNRYSYVVGNPLRHRDPSGHMFPSETITPWEWWYGSCSPIPQMQSLTVDFIPVVGDIKGLIEVFTGRDLITGEELGNWRYMGLLGLIGVAELRLLRHADEAGEAVLMLKVTDTVGATGQWQHVLSNKIMRALGEHETLRGIFERNDFLVRALDKAGHNGYQKWHIAYDDEVVRWLSKTPRRPTKSS